jgi:hypothetical protein
MTSAPSTSIVHRVIRIICPRAERGWLDAMFAELPSIDDGGARVSWTAGAAGTLAAVVRMRAVNVVPPSLWVAIALSLTGVVLFALGSQFEVEGAGMDDDAYLPFAWVATVLLVGFGVLAIIRIFVTPDELPRHRH